ncbi:hypothetical protein DCAR_0207185 [Daucus carota subsp. sativus]|uniref:Uncharacterized protein n=1 Tax=Daucus carota subsp. sativus TaxID=79200 RepID=A0A166DQC4_DAUCS|nr:hypothetical protein DCAR_0207185 [Daucus carota subsp. sativus]
MDTQRVRNNTPKHGWSSKANMWTAPPNGSYKLNVDASVATDALIFLGETDKFEFMEELKKCFTGNNFKV